MSILSTFTIEELRMIAKAQNVDADENMSRQ